MSAPCLRRKQNVHSATISVHKWCLLSNPLVLSLLAVTSILILHFAQQTASSDAPRYGVEKTSKTVVTRPAMRLSRVRYPAGRRIYLRRRKPILTSNRGIIAPKPYLRRKITNANTVGRPRPNSVTTQSTANASTHALQRNSTTKPPTTTPLATQGATNATTTAAQARRNITTAKSARPETTTTAFGRKSTKLRSMSVLHALKRMNKDVDYSDLLKKLDYFMSYYPTVREAASRLNSMLTKHEQTSREERRRIWKGVFRVKSDLRGLRGRCDGMYRNVTDVISKVGRHVNDFTSYQKTAKNKIDQIEIHQGSQDLQYFEVYERSANNTKDLQRLHSDMALLLPLVSDMVRNQEQNTLFEKEALKQLDSRARGNIAEMTNQILIQQSTLASLGDQVRSEMELLHAQKQTLLKSMEQHQKRLTDTVNSHVSTHLRQLNKIEGSMNRQSENIKYISSVLARHDEQLIENGGVKQAFANKVSNVSKELKEMKTNISQLKNHLQQTELRLNTTNSAVTTLESGAKLLHLSLNDQQSVLVDTMDRMNATNEVIKSVSDKLKAFKQEKDVKSIQVQQDLEEVLQKQKLIEDKLSQRENVKANRFMSSSQYPSDEPAPEATSVTPQELMTLLAEIGVEDRMSRLTRVLRHQQQRMSNVTRAVLRIAEDNEAIAMTSSHYFALINSQAKIIRDQNDTIGKLVTIATDQGHTIKSLSVELGGAQETVMKLTNIIASIASQMKSPMGSQRDCHDVWLNGNRESGVYNVIEDMSVRPIHCNLTLYGGWTVIQRRKDGSQDFDKTMAEYKHGFGDVYGEYWLGLETIKILTQKIRSSVGLQIIMEDWEGNFRYVTYSRFYLYGPNYNLAISEYVGDVADSLSSANGLSFTAKREDGGDSHRNSCPTKKRGGWWFAPQQNCGEANLNGVYRKLKPETRSQTTIHWKGWHGVNYPLKSVTMQIIPTDILISQLGQNELNPSDVKVDIDSDDALQASSAVQYGRFGESRYAELPLKYKNIKANIQQQNSLSYDTDLQEPGVLEQSPDYEIDYNLLLGEE